MAAQVKQAIVCGKVGGVLRRSAAFKVGRACQQQGARFTQRPGHMGFRRRAGVAYGQVKPFIGQVDKTIGQFQFNLNFRKGLEET